MSSSSIKKPNILFLMSDQHRFDIAGFNGNSIVRTPNLNSLSKSAVNFKNAYAPSPVCVPGRQSMLSGKYPGEAGCLNYEDDLPPNSMTFARRFSQYAYDTVCCGKLHHHGSDQMQGWNFRIGQDSPISSRYIDGYKKEEGEKYKRESQWWDWSKEVKRSGAGRCVHLGSDEIAIKGAKNIIDEKFLSSYYDQQNSLTPILLKVSLKFPHYPYMCNDDLFKYYLNRVSLYKNRDTFKHPVISRDWDKVNIGGDVSEREAIRSLAAYYGMIEMMDSMYGEVLDALRNAGEDLDDWIIVYASDHGDLMGEHGLWMKYKYFEGSVKVPLFIRFPQKFKPRDVTENVNLVDLFQTLCDLAEIPAPADLNSRSLVPLMKGDAKQWDNETISQLDDTMMIKRDDLKYQCFGGGIPDVLFDLKKDPAEKKDFSGDSSYQKKMKQFQKRRDELLARYVKN